MLVGSILVRRSIVEYLALTKLALGVSATQKESLLSASLMKRQQTHVVVILRHSAAI